MLLKFLRAVFVSSPVLTVRQRRSVARRSNLRSQMLNQVAR